MIDTHAHLYFDNFNDDRADIIKRIENDLDAVINIGVNFESNGKVIDLARGNKKFLSVIGFNPESVVKFLELGKSIDDLQAELGELLLPGNKIVGIGEIGLDYYWKEFASDGQKELQKKGFRTQIEFAQTKGLPVVIHSRDAFYDTFKILSDYKNETGFKGVWHSFTIDKSDGANGIGPKEQLEKVLSLGLYIGINGIVTFPSAKNLQELIKEAPLNRILLETDSPFLAPQPMRGKRNESVFVRYVAKKIAQIKEIPPGKVIEQTDENARELFGLKS